MNKKWAFPVLIRNPHIWGHCLSSTPSEFRVSNLTPSEFRSKESSLTPSESGKMAQIWVAPYYGIPHSKLAYPIGISTQFLRPHRNYMAFLHDPLRNSVCPQLGGIVFFFWKSPIQENWQGWNQILGVCG